MGKNRRNKQSRRREPLKKMLSQLGQLIMMRISQGLSFWYVVVFNMHQSDFLVEVAR